MSAKTRPTRPSMPLYSQNTVENVLHQGHCDLRLFTATRHTLPKHPVTFVKVFPWVSSKAETIRPRAREREPEVNCSRKVHVKTRQFNKVKRHRENDSNVTGALDKAICASQTSVNIFLCCTVRPYCRLTVSNGAQ